jgi:hypothetical protein
MARPCADPKEKPPRAPSIWSPPSPLDEANLSKFDPKSWSYSQDLRERVFGFIADRRKSVSRSSRPLMSMPVPSTVVIVRYLVKELGNSDITCNSMDAQPQMILRKNRQIT